jgi:hypothetical protein
LRKRGERQRTRKGKKKETKKWRLRNRKGHGLPNLTKAGKTGGVPERGSTVGAAGAPRVPGEKRMNIVFHRPGRGLLPQLVRRTNRRKVRKWKMKRRKRIMERRRST